jgi:acetyltransferase-like isoleucine patch superfamily enzyme
MTYKYFDIERQMERRRILKSLAPRFARLLYNKFQYASRYPRAFVSAGSKVAKTAAIGENCIIRESHIGPHVAIGDFTTTGPQSRFYGRGQIKVGKFCSIAPECLFWSENHNTANYSSYPFETVLKGSAEKEYIGEDITIGNDVWIGQRCMILAGANIGDGCIIAAGSVVTRGDYPAYSVIGGVPARVVKVRFNGDTVEKLIALQWWNKKPQEIFASFEERLRAGSKL